MNGATPIPIVILSGGEGNKLFLSKDETPKCMEKILGRPFVEHQLELFANKGAGEVTLLLGKFGGAVESYLDDECAGLSLKYIYDDYRIPPGTGSALLNAYHQLPEQFILTYGDTYPDFPWFGATFQDPFAMQPVRMTIYKNEGKHFPSNVEIDEATGEIVAYNNHVHSPQDAARLKYIEAGLLYVNKSALCYRLKRGLDDTLCDLVKLGMVATFETKERYYNIGVPSGARELERHLLLSSRITIPEESRR